MPDLVLRQVFAEYDYAVLCKMERVCKRWMNIINAKFRKEIHEVSIERLGSSFPQTHQCIPFRRLSISCPSDSHDFLAGVFRRSRLSILKMTTDINFLAGIDQIYVAKDTGRRYFSNVEDLWLLIIHPDDDVTRRFLSIEETLFSELNQLTLQVHVNPRYYRNVSEIVKSFILRYPKSNINLELHAEKSMHILNQMSVLPSLPLYKIKLICTDFDQPTLRLDQLYSVMREQNIQAKNITMRDWSLFADGTTPVSYNPLDTFRISSCSIETVDNLVKSLQMTATQTDDVPPVKKKRVVKKKLESVEVVTEEGVAVPKPKKKKIVKKVVKKKKVPTPFIKKLEIAGQCILHGLAFLQQRAHTELERRLTTVMPELDVDCSEIYYCW
uniref:F-box domain-containing protein n=1 Tax=Caenorhabditis japonica TaxID=281687 RepID=A0A8R1I9T1_CAEJA